MKELKRLGIIGVGNLGYALIRGFVQSGTAMPENISVFDIEPSRREAAARDFKVRAIEDIIGAITGDTQIAILAVKPQTMQEVLVSIVDSVHEKLVLISVAAGITTDFILSHLNRPARVILSYAECGRDGFCRSDCFMQSRAGG